MELRTDMTRQHSTLDLIHELENVNDKFLIVDNLLKSTLDMHAPLVTVKIKNRPYPFITDEIKVMMRNRDHLHRIFLSTRRQRDWMAFVTLAGWLKLTLSLHQGERKKTTICRRH